MKGVNWEETAFGMVPQPDPVSTQGKQTGWQYHQIASHLILYSYRCLTPSKLRLRSENFTSIGSSSYHSFAIQEDGTVWGWGSNLYGEARQETGLIDKVGDWFSIPAIPRIICTLNIVDDAVTKITGGENYSIARTRIGFCLVWGLE